MRRNQVCAQPHRCRCGRYHQGGQGGIHLADSNQWTPRLGFVRRCGWVTLGLEDVERRPSSVNKDSEDAIKGCPNDVHGKTKTARVADDIARSNLPELVGMGPVLLREAMTTGEDQEESGRGDQIDSSEWLRERHGNSEEIMHEENEL